MFSKVFFFPLLLVVVLRAVVAKLGAQEEDTPLTLLSSENGLGASSKKEGVELPFSVSATACL